MPTATSTERHGQSVPARSAWTDGLMALHFVNAHSEARVEIVSGFALDGWMQESAEQTRNLQPKKQWSIRCLLAVGLHQLRLSAQGSASVLRCSPVRE